MSTAWEQFLEKHRKAESAIVSDSIYNHGLAQEEPQVGVVRDVPTKCKACNVENENTGVCRGCGAQQSYQV